MSIRQQWLLQWICFHIAHDHVSFYYQNVSFFIKDGYAACIEPCRMTSFAALLHSSHDIIRPLLFEFDIDFFADGELVE